MYDVIVLLMIATAVLGRGHLSPFRLPPLVFKIFENTATLPVTLVCLIAAQHAYLSLMADASYHQMPTMPFLRHTPIRVLTDLGGPTHIAQKYGDCFAALALIESFSLGCIYYALARPRRWQLALVVVAVAIAYFDAVRSTATTSSDMYAYVGFTLLDKNAYTPVHQVFTGSYRVINELWGTPLVPAPYGPLWLAISGWVVYAGTTLAEKLYALKLLGVATMLVVTALIAALRFPARIVAIVALDPALTFQFVTNAHNDLLAVAFLLGSRLAATRSAFVPAVTLGALAALVKLPFLLFVAIAFVPFRGLRQRVGAYAASVALALAISWLWGGPAYLAALLHQNMLTFGRGAVTVLNPAIIVKIVVLVGITLAFYAGIWIEALAWALPAISAAFFPWYLSWSLTYAVASKSMLRNTAIALPLVEVATDTTLGNGKVIVFMYIAFCTWLVVRFAKLVLTRRRFSTAWTV